jgi:hypothetical protein
MKGKRQLKVTDMWGNYRLMLVGLGLLAVLIAGLVIERHLSHALAGL